ncbi:hypothetical protein FCL40_01120 [Ferrimonas sediminicola]|uniref:Phage integrase family protein n=1 Tax=Ferrimonas sediminicola TaxID=2569538 RepID=A0A4U1BKN4_9GAMM|nr:site-specific integrase [Ferrimonas sediminicola]TKB51187.1 hypothetical protein FCL40_01120 [Ferrimonas sediminicola]
MNGHLNYKSTQQSLAPDWRKSKMGYEFDVNSDIWQLDGSVSLNLGRMRNLDDDTRLGLRLALCRYAEELAANTTDSVFTHFNRYCDSTGEPNINVVGLTNWRATLTGDKESVLGSLKSFLLAWYDWEFPGMDTDSVDYLESLTLKGAVKGKAVKGACPYSGPLSPQEQGALLDWAVNAFTQQILTLWQYSLLLSLSFTGRRMVQIRYLRACDLVAREDNGGREYALKVPRVKQKGMDFREDFRTIGIVPDLYHVLKNQSLASQEYVERCIGTSLPEAIKQQIPLFIEMERVDNLTSLEQLIDELESRPDFLHMSKRTAGDELAKVAKCCSARSERTGDFIHVTSRRFRYTKGTNLARRGIKGVELAYALDHSDTQHVTVYAENTPETAEIIDEVMAPVLAPLAQAFAGKLIDSERDALRANDPHSRIKNQKHHSVGSCGTHSFCLSGYRACYTCVNFQPWRDAPHEEVRDEIIEERRNQQAIGISPSVIQSTDRLLLAVEQVIRLCKLEKENVVKEEEVKNG